MSYTISRTVQEKYDMDLVQANSKLNEYNMSLLAQGQIESLRQQLSQFSTADIAKHPLLSILEAWTAILTGDLQRSQQFTSWAEQSFTKPHQSLVEHDLQGHIAALTSVQAFFINDANLSLKQIDTTLTQYPECSDWVQSILFFIQGYGLFQTGKFTPAQQSLKRAVETGLKSDNFHTTILAQCIQSWILRIQGKLQQAQQTIYSTKMLCQRITTNYSPLQAYISTEQSRIYFEHYQLQKALSLLTKPLNLSAQNQAPESRITSLILLVRLQLETGNRTAAQQTMAEVSELAETIGYEDNFAELRSQQAIMSLIAGDIPGCLNKLPTLSSLQQPIDIKNFIPTLIYSIVLLYEKRDRECHALVQPWVEMTAREDLWGLHIDFALQRVRSLLNSHPEKAIISLEELIQLARPEGLLRPFAQRKYWLAHLLPKLSPEAQVFLNSIVKQPLQNPKPESPLSRREHEVLKLVALGHSNQELAEALHVSLGTVKTHIHHILKKLEADNRTAAVAAARKQGLV